MSAVDVGLSALPAHLGSEPAATALVQMVERLRAGWERERMAAVLLAGFDAADAAPPAAESDPVASMWLSQRCGLRSSCGGRAVARWHELEPGNAAAWLAWVDGRPAEQPRVLAGLVQASSFQLHEDALLAVALNVQPAGLPPYLEPALWAYVIGVQAALQVSQFQVASSLCAVERLGEPGRRAACERLAELMVDRSDVPLALYMGAKLGERLGWPAERTQAARKRSEEAFAAAPFLDEQQPLSCDSIERARELLRRRAGLSPYSSTPPQSR